MKSCSDDFLALECLKASKSITSVEWFGLVMDLVMLDAVADAGGLGAIRRRVDAAIASGMKTRRFKNAVEGDGER